MGDLAEVRVEAVLRRLVVIGADLQRAIRAGVFGGLGEVNRFLRRVGATAGDDFAATFGVVNRQLYDAHVFLEIHRGRFTGGAHGHNAVHAAFDLQLHEFLEGSLIQSPFYERRDQCSVNSRKHFCADANRWMGMDSRGFGVLPHITPSPYLQIQTAQVR